MKNILIIVLLFFATGLQAQILPNQSPEKAPQGTDAIYTQENGQLNKILLDSAFHYFVPRINVNILGYNLDTLNATNPDSLRGQFVRDVSESWHYVDSSGLAFKFAASSGGGATTLNQLTDVALTSSATGEVLRYNGSLWVNDSIKSLHNIDSLSFNTSAPSVTETGSLGWNNEDQTLDLKINGVTLQIGQEIYKIVKNVSGATIQNGQVVRYSGAVGASSRIEADLMIADGTYPAYHILGVATEPDGIANNDLGFITPFGAVRGINTSGYTAGDILYVDPTTPGALTNVEPTAPNQDIPVAIALDSKNNGSIFVRPVLFPALNDVQDVTISNIATGQVLRYDGTKWANSTERDTSDTNEIQYLTFRGDTLELTDDPTNVILPYLRVESDPIYAADSAQLKADIAALFVDSTRLLQDSILVYYQDGSEVGRDTIVGTGSDGGLTDTQVRAIVSDSVFQFRSLSDFVNTSKSFSIGTRIKINDTGAEYLIEVDSVSGYATDTVAVVPNGSNYAVLQPQLNGFYISEHFRKNDDNTTITNAFAFIDILGKKLEITKLYNVILPDTIDTSNEQTFLIVNSDSVHVKGNNINSGIYFSGLRHADRSCYGIRFFGSFVTVDGIMIRTEVRGINNDKGFQPISFFTSTNSIFKNCLVQGNYDFYNSPSSASALGVAGSISPGYVNYTTITDSLAAGSSVYASIGTDLVQLEVGQSVIVGDGVNYDTTYIENLYINTDSTGFLLASLSNSYSPGATIYRFNNEEYTVKITGNTFQDITSSGITSNIGGLIISDNDFIRSAKGKRIDNGQGRHALYIQNPNAIITGNRITGNFGGYAISVETKFNPVSHGRLVISNNIFQNTNGDIFLGIVDNESSGQYVNPEYFESRGGVLANISGNEFINDKYNNPAIERYTVATTCFICDTPYENAVEENIGVSISFTGNTVSGYTRGLLLRQDFMTSEISGNNFLYQDTVLQNDILFNFSAGSKITNNVFNFNSIKDDNGFYVDIQIGNETVSSDFYHGPSIVSGNIFQFGNELPRIRPKNNTSLLISNNTFNINYTSSSFRDYILWNDGHSNIESLKVSGNTFRLRPDVDDRITTQNVSIFNSVFETAQNIIIEDNILDGAISTVRLENADRLGSNIIVKNNSGYSVFYNRNQYESGRTPSNSGLVKYYEGDNNIGNTANPIRQLHRIMKKGGEYADSTDVVQGALLSWYQSSPYYYAVHGEINHFANVATNSSWTKGQYAILGVNGYVDTINAYPYTSSNFVVKLLDSGADWLASTAYKKGDKVFYDGVAWECYANHTSNALEPPIVGNKYWMRTGATGLIIQMNAYPEVTNPYGGTNTVQASLDSTKTYVDSKIVANSVTISAGTNSTTYTFPVAKSNTNYIVTTGSSVVSGSPSSAELTVSISKTVNDITFTVQGTLDVGESVKVDFIVID